MDGTLLIYGSYGYTGDLITRRAVDDGATPIVAGRRAEPLEEQATEFELDHQAFSLTHPDIIESSIADVDAVLNCAGPFSGTAEPLIDACLETGTNYLDIAGRVEVLESIAERDREAETADVTLLPGVGFDVVPTDCLAAILNAKLPETEHLTLALDGLENFSPGTVKSIIESVNRPSAMREDGEIQSVSPAWQSREFDFGSGEQTGVMVPWGALSTAYYSTGIGTIETYATVPQAAVRSMRYGTAVTPILTFGPIQQLLLYATDCLVSGPTQDERIQSTTRLFGEVTNGAGDRATARLTTPGIYDVTAATAVESARRVLSDEVESGFQTPSSAFGADFITEFDGVTLEVGEIT
ncbi:saccharopine dehydrogenase family protein [Halocatena marina]|uniref:saccharopine dehydrogenase family protein n=1 Tax=Halocatena marina TaxID=2934937 RepID=UPI00200CFE1E|nr:saccharopine dehydrogenase NADP-binding domain-containing protein [Halocatena marina]